MSKLAAALAVISVVAPASAQARPVDQSVTIAQARHAIHGAFRNIAISVTDCHRSARMTACTVTGTLEIEDYIPAQEITTIREQHNSWTEYVYRRGHRVFVAEG